MQPHSITTNQAAIIALFRVVNRYVGNLAPMPGVFPSPSLCFTMNSQSPLEAAKFLDFAVIWDEDHDERVLLPIERLYRSGDLSSFIMFGERKGMFFCHVAPRFNGVRLPTAEAAVAAACENVGGDNWSGHISFAARSGGGIINADERSVELYLKTINMLWKLGPKDIVDEDDLPEPDI